jgi:hypothetical protein
MDIKNISYTNFKLQRILSVRDRASLIDVLNENQRMQQCCIRWFSFKLQRVNFCKLDVYICASETHSREPLLSASREI